MISAEGAVVVAPRSGKSNKHRQGNGQGSHRRGRQNQKNCQSGRHRQGGHSNGGGNRQQSNSSNRGGKNRGQGRRATATTATTNKVSTLLTKPTTGNAPSKPTDFRAGGVGCCTALWPRFTSDKWVLDMVQGLIVELQSIPTQSKIPDYSPLHAEKDLCIVHVLTP